MTKTKLYFWSAFLVFLITLYLLLTGSSILVYSLDSENTIPLGTFITWAGMIALPVAIYWSHPELRNPSNTWTKSLGTLLKVIMISAILWVPVSYLLAGNMSFSFSEKETFQGGQKAMQWFWRLSYGISFGAVGVWAFYWVGRLLKRLF